MSRVTVRPAAFRAFAERAQTFCMVTDADRAADFELTGAGYDTSFVVPVPPGEDLGAVLAAEVPESADVLVVCRESFLTSPDASAIGEGRRLMVMPCASTPVTFEQVRYFLDVVARTDPAAQAIRADRFFDRLAAADEVWLTDPDQVPTCSFEPFAAEYEWNQQAGPLAPGEQQIAPAGELSVLPMEITDFDPARGLALNGSLTLHGQPIVHAGYDPALSLPQAGLYERLIPLIRHPVVIDLKDGVITGCRPGSPAAAAADLAAVLEDLLTEEPAYRTVWELGFGINTEMRTVPGNCGLNEPYGGADGVIHLGLGLTPYTRFALTFLSPALQIVDQSGANLLSTRERRVNRVRSASCGCNP